MMTLDPALVSVITPAFNAGRFIERCVESVTSQSYRSFEMFVVDDCSTDNTADLVQACSDRDSRVRLIRRTQNGGPAAARNTALKEASGRYIAFLDSDDLWTDRKLEEQLRFMNDRNAALSFTAYRKISEKDDLISEVIQIPHLLNYDGLLKNTAIATTTVIVDRSKTGPFEMKTTYYDDFSLWLSLLKRGFLAHGHQADLARYRVVGGSWSGSKGRSALHVWKAYRDVEQLSLPYSAWCFIHYAVNAIRKHCR